MRRRRANLGLAALCALPSARPDMLVVSGPPQTLGLRLAAVPYEFSAQTFAAAGRARLMEPSEWSADCPPAYTGSESLAGVVLIAVDISPETLCSYEQRASSAARAGAAAWVTAVSGSDVLAALDPVPGFNARSYREGDTRSLAGIAAADVRSVANYALVRALRDGADVRVTLAPSPSAYAATFASAGYVVWQALIVLHAASVLELALCRSYAFARADGGVRLSRQQVVLWAESLAALARIGYFAVDPIEARGLYSRTVSRALLVGQLALGHLATAVFDVVFAEAVTASGLAQCRLATPWHKRLLIGSALGMIGVEALVAALHTALAPRALRRAALAWQADLAFASLLLVGAVFPCALLVVSWRSSSQARRATTSATDAPRSRLLSELMQWMRLTLCYQAAALPLVLLLPWAFQGPLRQLLVLFALMLLANAKSYVQVFAMRPVYERPPQGPLKLLRDAAAALLRLACDRPQQPRAGTSRLVEQANIAALTAQQREHAARQRAPVVPLTPIPEASVAKRSRGSSEPAGGRAAPRGSILQRWLTLRSSSSDASSRATTAAGSFRKSASPAASKRASVESRRPSVARPSACSYRRSLAPRESGDAARSRASCLVAAGAAPEPPPAPSARPLGAGGAGGGTGTGTASSFGSGSRRGKVAPAGGAAGPSAAGALDRVSRLLASRGRTTPTLLRVSNSSSSLPEGSSTREGSPNPHGSPGKAALLAAGKGPGWEEGGASCGCNSAVSPSRPSLSPNLEVVAEAADDARSDGVRGVRGLRLSALRALIVAHAWDESVSTAAVGAALNAHLENGAHAYADTCAHAELGRASALVVHAAACSFVRLVEALEAHGERALVERSRRDARGGPPERLLAGSGAQCYWLDALCARPRGAAEDAALAAARAREIGSVVVVLEPLGAALVLRQTPTIYQLAQLARARGVRAYATATRAERERLLVKVVTASVEATRAIKEELARVDSRASRAATERDKQQLLELARADAEPVEHVCARLDRDAREVVLGALAALIATLLVPAADAPPSNDEGGAFQSGASPSRADAGGAGGTTPAASCSRALYSLGAGIARQGSSASPTLKGLGSLSQLRAQAEIEHEVELRMMAELEREEAKRVSEHDARRISGGWRMASQGTTVDASYGDAFAGGPAAGRASDAASSVNRASESIGPAAS